MINCFSLQLIINNLFTQSLIMIDKSFCNKRSFNEVLIAPPLIFYQADKFGIAPAKLDVIIHRVTVVLDQDSISVQ